MTLRFDADLDVSVSDGSRVAVTADRNGDLVLSTDALRPLVRALRADGGLPSGMLRTVSDGLAEAGATVHLRTSSTDLLTVGEGAVPDPLARAARLRHVRVRSARGLFVALRPPLRPVVVAGAVVLAAALLAALGARHRPDGFVT